MPFPPPTPLRATLLSAGVRGKLSLSQRSRFDPTLVRYDVHFPGQDAAAALRGLRVHELPPLPRLLDPHSNPCNHTGAVYDPEEKGVADSMRGTAQCECCSQLHRCPILVAAL